MTDEPYDPDMTPSGGEFLPPLWLQIYGPQRIDASMFTSPLMADWILSQPRKPPPPWHIRYRRRIVYRTQRIRLLVGLRIAGLTERDLDNDW